MVAHIRSRLSDGDDLSHVERERLAGMLALEARPRAESPAMPLSNQTGGRPLGVFVTEVGTRVGGVEVHERCGLSTMGGVLVTLVLGQDEG